MNDSVALGAQMRLLSPRDAKAYLLNAAQPRTSLSSAGVYRAHVASLLNEMQKDRWVLSPFPICFDTNGHLVDGIHRMTALAKMDDSTRLPFYVLENVNESQTRVIDRNKPRSLADVLHLQREPVELAVFYYKLMLPGTVSWRPAADPLDKVSHYLKGWSDYLSRRVPKRTLLWGSIPVRAAVVLIAIEHGESRDLEHAIKVYDAQVSNRIKDLPPVALGVRQSFEGRTNSRPYLSGEARRQDLFARSLVMFDIKRQSAVRALVKDTTLDIVRERVVTALEGDFPEFVNEAREAKAP